MNYNLKDKIEVTEEFIKELISKNWQEVDVIQKQLTNIDTSSTMGNELAHILKNACASLYTLIGCLENLLDDPEQPIITKTSKIAEIEPDNAVCDEAEDVLAEPEIPIAIAKDSHSTDFEPFEYFVDFDEPSGSPITDKDLYN